MPPPSNPVNALIQQTRQRLSQSSSAMSRTSDPKQLKALDQTVARLATNLSRLHQLVDTTNTKFGETQTQLRSVTGSLRQFTTAVLAGGAALAATMKTSMDHWNPAAVTRFQQRLGDLQAVIGSMVAPAFESMTRTIHDVSNWLLNLSPSTKKLIADFVKIGVPLTALTAALGGLALLVRPVFALTGAMWRLVAATSAASGAQGASAGGAYAARLGRGAGIGRVLGTGVGFGLGAYAAESMGYTGLGGELIGGGIGAYAGGKALGWAGGALASSPSLAFAMQGMGLAARAGLPGIIGGAAGFAGTLGIDAMTRDGHMIGGTTKKNGSLSDAMTYAHSAIDMNGVGAFLNPGRSLASIQTPDLLSSDARRAYALGQSNSGRSEKGLGLLNELGKLETDPQILAALSRDMKKATESKNVNEFAAKTGFSTSIKQAGETDAEYKERISKKDSTGLDAARSATTFHSVLDAGRVMREAAITDTGRDAQQMMGKDIGLIHQLIKSIAEKLGLGVNTATANALN